MDRLLKTTFLVPLLWLASTGIVHAQGQYLGEVRLFGFNFCPVQWVPAAGQLLPISQYSGLFTLYGTYYGGDGTSNFALPNLTGRAPVGTGPAEPIGALYGAPTVTLTIAQMPTHTHQAFASSVGESSNSPSGALLGTFAPTNKIYTANGAPANTAMAANMIGTAGGNQPVPTQSPVIAMTWCVALTGIFPAQQ